MVSQRWLHTINLYPLGHITTGVFWHNLHENSIHLTVADTGWGKAVWGKLYGQWFAGAAVFVFNHDKFTAEKILKKIEKYRITSFCAPPTVYRFMIHEDLSTYDLSSLEYCTTAGEALNPSVYEKFYKITGVKIDGRFRSNRNDYDSRNHALAPTKARLYGQT